MRRKPLAAVLALLSVALVLGGNALLDAGWGSALRSIADRMLPNPEITMWRPRPSPAATRAPTPTPPRRGRTTSTWWTRRTTGAMSESSSSSSSDGSRTARGWLEIEARGGSGVRYRACDAAEAPAAARGALDR